MNENKQINFRPGKDTLGKIDAIRRSMEPIPPISEVIRLAIERLHHDTVGKGRRK
jgi:hypothetical protein